MSAFETLNVKFYVGLKITLTDNDQVHFYTFFPQTAPV